MQNLAGRLIPPVCTGRHYGAMADEVMDYRGLSSYLKMAQGTLRHQVMRGEIPCIKIGRNVRFAKKDIDAWLKEHRRLPKRIQDENAGDGLFAVTEAVGGA